MAKLKNELPARECDYCGTPYRPRRTDSRFCEPKCRKDFWRKREVRGAQAVDLLIRWRKSRNHKGSGKGVLSEMAALADQWIREDEGR